METRQRTLVKALIWNLIGLVMMSIIGFLFTGSAGVSGGIALINTATGLVTYILYERVWAKLQWGRNV